MCVCVLFGKIVTLLLFILFILCASICKRAVEANLSKEKCEMWGSDGGV